MIKVIVTDEFNLGKFNEIKNIERANINKKENGHLYLNDKFECTEEMAEYLTGKNALKKSFVKIIEIIPKDAESEEKKVTTRRRKRTIAKD